MNSELKDRLDRMLHYFHFESDSGVTHKLCMSNLNLYKRDGFITKKEYEESCQYIKNLCLKD